MTLDHRPVWGYSDLLHLMSLQTGDEKHSTSATAPALFSALVVTQVFARGQQLAIDARLAGLATALLGAWLRAPTLAVLVGAAVATSVWRALAR